MTDYLSDKPDALIELIADHLGFTNVSHNKYRNEIRFAKEEGSNPTGVVMNLSTLAYTNFPANEHGNLYTLVMKKYKIGFPQALDYIGTKLGLNKQQFKNDIKLPFGGFYKKIIRQQTEPESEMKTYDESILEPYLGKYNLMFLRDGISFETQQEYKVGYDVESGRITIPIWTLNGQLCGIMGRLNDPNCPKEDRWLPIIPCSRSYTLYGYHINYLTIQEKGVAVICESEKAVQQLHSMGSSVGLATGGFGISETQAKYIKGLMVPKIILAVDEGIEEPLIIELAKKKLCVSNSVYQNKVGYIWDSDNEILPKGSKMSPTDLGKEAFLSLYKRKVVWLQ